MYAAHNHARRQQKRIHTYQTSCDSYRFFNLLTSETLFDKVEQLLPAHRERLYPPTETLSMFLAQSMSADKSCQNSVNQAALHKLGNHLKPGSTRTGGYCRARQRLPLSMVTQLTQHLGECMDARTPDDWRWQGRRVRLVDGTTVTMPDTDANQQAFPQQTGQQLGLGFPICRLVGITCLSSGALLNAAVGRFNGKGGDEQTLLRSLQETFASGDIVLGDAFFATYFFIASMLSKGVDILMQQQGARKRVTDFRRGTKLGQRDHIIILDKPKVRPQWMTEEHYAKAPATLTLRELKAGNKILVTTMNCPAHYTKDALRSLYKNRWQVELDIRHIKDTMGMNILSCKTPEMAIKEIWITLLAYNLIRLMMSQSSLLTDVLPRQLSFKHCLQLWRHYLQGAVAFNDEQISSLLLIMAQQRAGNRSGRIEPRAVKRRPKAYPLLMQTRNDARAQVIKYGHAKKLK